MKTRRALVTGGCGFVGRHFAKTLLGLGFHVTVVDDLSTGLAVDGWPPHLRPTELEADRLVVHIADARQYFATAEPDFDLILHLAAVVGGRIVIGSDPLKVATDLAIDAMFFHWIVSSAIRPRKVLFFSSSAAYPIALQRAETWIPLREELIELSAETFGVPDMTYGWAKLTGELLARHAVEQYGVDVISYRPFSGYGEDQDLTYPFPSIVKRVRDREDPLIVWGSGTQQRDFIYIDDVVQAVLASYEKLEAGSALNLGSGVGTSFFDLASLACRVVGHEALIVNDASKPEGVHSRVGDCAAMLAMYEPQVTLADGIGIVHDYQHSQALTV